MFLTYQQSRDKDLVSYLAEQVVLEPVVSVKCLPGSMAHNYLINHKYVLKLPNEYTETDDWLRQSQCAPILQNYLTFQIPQPYLKPIFTPEKQSLLSSSYRKIDGVCLMDDAFAVKNKQFKQKFFEQLSDAVEQIHSISPGELPFKLPTKIDYLEKSFFRNFKNDTYFPKKIFRKLMHNSFLGLGHRGLKSSLLVHTDLHSGNVLLNDKNELVGLLDFDTMVCGDRFLEFRPKLYPDLADTYLFREVYQKQTGVHIDPNDLYQLETANKTLRWFCALCNLYDALPLKERNKKIKQDFKKKVASVKNSKSV